MLNVIGNSKVNSRNNRMNSNRDVFFIDEQWSLYIQMAMEAGYWSI
jgi:hypothetical protein